MDLKTIIEKYNLDMLDLLYYGFVAFMIFVLFAFGIFRGIGELGLSAETTILFSIVIVTMVTWGIYYTLLFRNEKNKEKNRTGIILDLNGSIRRRMEKKA